MGSISMDLGTAATRDQRVMPRTNLYLSATLRWQGGQCAVRIRNLSANGAMVESGVLPPVGAPIELLRGCLGARGSAAWIHAGRGGLRLDDVIAVREWMAPATNGGQQRVDGLVAAVRSGDRSVDLPRSSSTSVPPHHDLQLAERLLSRLGDALVADPEVIARHGFRLQSLDVVQQLLAALQTEGAAGTARLDDLRRSAAAALEA